VAVFEYQAYDQNQASVAGAIAADTPRQARDRLRDRGLVVQRVKEQAGRSARGWWSAWFPSRHARQWTMSAHELSMLLRAGIPLLEALDTISRQHGGRFRAALMTVRDRVSAGHSLADAMRDRPDVFDSLSVHLVEVGQNAGTLDEVLSRLADFKQRMMQLKDRVFTALTYPMFLVVFGLAATLFLMTYVMPPLLENLQEQLEVLPWPTLVVKSCSDVLIEHGLLLGLVSAVLLSVLVIALQTPRGRRLWHRLLLKIPLVGPMALKQNIARSAIVVATLTRSGVMLTKALELAARSTNNLILRQALHDSSQEVGAGRAVATALENSNVIPPLAVRIFSVGQESGELEDMLEQLSVDYERQVATTAARLTALLEPILIVVLAVLVGFVLLATILPILEAGNVL